MKIFYRFYQWILRGVSPLLPWRIPTLIEGPGALENVPESMANLAMKKALIVTDQGLVDSGLVRHLQKILESHQCPYHLFAETEANPSIETILKAKTAYLNAGCDGLIAFGGGSPIDCAKVLGASIARPKKPIEKMKGILKIRKAIPPLIAIPTTAGTGSEATLAAVVSNPKTKEKYAINDHALIPNVAILDAELTVKLPPSLTAYTGMDALTHAIEAAIGRSNTKDTWAWSEKAITLIHQALVRATTHPEDLNARAQMLKASYYAGLSFTRAYVGNIHAIAHTLGGFYRLPHGYTNAVILPRVLRAYGDSVVKPLAKMARTLYPELNSTSDQTCANHFIEWIESLNSRFNIPQHIPEIQTSDIAIMAKRAYKEANPLYPVPMIFSLAQFKEIYHQLKA